MGWNEFDNKHKKAIDKSFVSCEEWYERYTIKRILKEEFPYMSESTINTAIENCCQAIPAPRPRDRYMQCLRQRLGA